MPFFPRMDPGTLYQGWVMPLLPNFDAPAAAPPWSRARWLVFFAFWGGVLFLSWHLYDILLGSNFHAVVPGQIYRGAQHSGPELEKLIARQGIRTIVNLRGLGANAAWYLEQGRAVQKAGIAQEDVCLSATRLPSQHEVRRVVEIFDRSERPLYVHCRRGSDRTGLVCAMFLLLDDSVSRADAMAALHWRYGHFNLSKTARMDDFFELYEDYLAETGQKHSASVFRNWAISEYRGGRFQCVVESCEPLQESFRTFQLSAFRVRVKNHGTTPVVFKPQKLAGCHVGVQIFDSEDNLLWWEFGGMFHRTLPPGESLEMTVELKSLDKAGRYRLSFDMYEPQNYWGFQLGWEPREMEIEVRD